jgi:hypothetical protein
MVKESNPGYAGGIAKRSNVTRLAWALKGATVRQKDLRLNSMSAVAEGRKLRDRVTELMKKAGADPADAVVFVVWAKPDLSAFSTAEMSLTNGPSDIALATAGVAALPIGFLVFVWDKQDPEQSVFGHPRPLIVEDPRAVKLNEQAYISTANKLQSEMLKGGVISDKRN